MITYKQQQFIWAKCMSDLLEQEDEEFRTGKRNAENIKKGWRKTYRTGKKKLI